MNPRTRLNIAMVGGLIVLGLLFWLTPSEEAEHESLLALSPAEVTHIAVRRDGQPYFTLERVAGEWRVTSPFEAPADDRVVGQILAVIRAPVRSRYSPDDIDVGRFGLDHPTIELEIDGRRVAFGDAEPVDRRRYALRGDELVMVDEMIHYRLSLSPDQLVDRRILPPGGAIERIRFPDRELVRDELGHWTLTPEAEAIDADRVAEVWRRIDAREVRGWDGAGAEQLPVIEVNLFGRPDPVRLYVIEHGEPLVLGNAVRGLRYRIVGEQAHELLPDA
jgi:hypothetical protein